MVRAWILVAVLVVVAACGGSSGNASPPATKGALATPDPLNIQITVDASKSASALIGPSGGQVTATAAAGVSMTLDVPSGALLSPHTITLTPLVSAIGLPLKGGLLAGAELSPDGLLLAQAATLKITPAAATPGGMKTYGFGFHRDGAELYLKPAAAGGTAFTLIVWHFSGAGVGAGTSADANTQAANHAPTAPQDQVEQALAVGQQVIPLLLGWQAQLDAELGQPSPNLALLDVIYQQLFAFQSMAIAAGRPDLPNALYAKMGLVLKTASALALTRCVSDPDPVQGLRVIRWIEWAQSHPAVLQHLDAPTLESGVVKCLRFRLDFSTTVDTAFGPEAVNLSVESKDIALNAISAVPLKFAPGHGDIKYTAYTWQVPGIPYTVATTTVRQFSTLDLSMNLDAVDSTNTSAVVDGMSLTVDFGDTTETVTVKAPYPISLPFKSFYANGMQNAHRDVMAGPNLYKISPWIVAAKPVFATAHQGCPCPSPSSYITYTQDTLFQLRHTPG
jgi:hypothetical protein